MADTLLARLMDWLSELEAPKEAADAAETVEQEPAGHRVPAARCPRRSGGHTGSVVAQDLRLVDGTARPDELRTRTR
jgi:hypothetical protein